MSKNLDKFKLECPLCGEILILNLEDVPVVSSP